MRIIIDRDACPGISIIQRVVKKYRSELMVFCDIHRYITLDYGKVRVVNSESQSMDMYTVNICKSNDIVVSQDYEVAATYLGKRTYILDPRGYLHTEENIDRMLEERHVSRRVRRAGERTSNPKKRTSEDDLGLERSLIRTIECNFRG